MKVNELMVGDFIYQHHPKDNTPHIVKVSVDTLNLMDRMKIGFIQEQSPLYRIIEPIPLTTEILEKNGFTKGGMFGKTYYLAVEDFEISVYFAHVNTQLIIEKRNGREIINMLNAEYLHILQHALRLCGIEKQIEL